MTALQLSLLRPETAVPSPYRALFAAPGSKGFSAAGLVGRMPLSMMGIGVVTMVSQLTGRYRLAGALSATISRRVSVRYGAQLRLPQ